MRKARVMPAWERIQGHEAGARIFPKLLKKKYLYLFSWKIKFHEKAYLSQTP